MVSRKRLIKKWTKSQQNLKRIFEIQDTMQDVREESFEIVHWNISNKLERLYIFHVVPQSLQIQKLVMPSSPDRVCF